MLQASFKNKLIQKLSAEDFHCLSPEFERFETFPRQVLVKRNEPVDFVYFPESGHASVLVKVPKSEPIESGMIGREGMTDLAVSGRSHAEIIVQMPGEAIRLRRTFLLQAVQERGSLALLVLSYQQAFSAQVSFTALSHGSFTVAQRLARFLLMADDRSDSSELPFVHDFFAWMLAVRRAGVTDAMHRLAAGGAIVTERGKVRILDREVLKELAGGSYGAAEAEYERIFASQDGGALNGQQRPTRRDQLESSTRRRPSSEDSGRAYHME